MCSAPVGEGANRRRRLFLVMLIGAHVSTAGGLANAIERGEERGCESIQIFHQSPRMWRPTKYGEADFAAFREAMEASKSVDAVIIHAVYLINCATKDKELRKKSLGSLTHALRIGDGIGARGVVLHPGSQKDDPLAPSLKRATTVIAAALADSESCPLLIEQTAGHKGLLATRLRPDRGADRAGRERRAPRPLPRLLPPLRPGLRHHRRGPSRRRPRRSRRQGRDRPPRRRPRQRRRRPARLLPRPPRQHRQR